MPQPSFALNKIYHLRKLIVSINLSLDGFFAGPEDEMDWHFSSWTPDMNKLFCEQLINADTIVLGRITYLKMSLYWTGLMQDVQYPRDDYPLVALLRGCTKIVFSRSTLLPVWDNSKVVGTVPELELKLMKDRPGHDMIVLGSGLLVQSLISAGIIDELILWIHPVVLSRGRLLFTTMSGNCMLTLKRKVKTDSGVVVLFYEVSQCAD